MIMDRKSGKKDLDDFQYLIDSRNLTDKERGEEREAILKAREARYRDRSENDREIAKLLQLKYQMEEYVNDSKGEDSPHFSRFLKIYVDTLYKKRKDFAADIGISPMELSHILNDHREPKDSFLYRLIVHSQSSFRNLCGFNRNLWPKVFYQDKVRDFMASSEKWKRSEEKFVKGKAVTLSQ